MRKLHLVMLLGSFCLLLAINRATLEAREQYKNEFEKLYVKDPPTNAAEEKWAETVKDAKCLVCHVGKKKKDRNEYGKQLTEKLGKKNEKDSVKIEDALKAMEKEPSDPDDPKSPKFGDRIKGGKLPVDLKEK